MASSILSSLIPTTGISLSFIDNDGKRINGLTVDQANKVAEKKPNTKFFFQSGDGVEKRLTIKQVNKLLSKDLLPKSTSCPTEPQVCGPPLVRFFGGKNGFGASANAIISPISSSVIGFDIVNSGFGFLGSPSAEVMDQCGKGSGAKLKVNMEDDDEDTAGTDGTTTLGEQQSLAGVAGAAGTGAAGTGAAGTPVTFGGTGGTPITSNGTIVTFGGTGGTPVTVNGSPVLINGSPLTVGGIGGIPITSGGTGGTPLTVGNSRVTVGGSGGIPLSAGVNPLTSNELPIVLGAVTSSTRNANSFSTQCDIPRAAFEKSIIRKQTRSQKIKNITILSPGDGYLAAPDGSLGGNERVWKEPDEGYVQTKCGGYYTVQPYRPILVQAGDTYYPPDGPPRVLQEDEVITLPLVPVTPPRPENLGVTYPVVLIIDEIEVLDPGFGYRPGDRLIISPDKGAEAELVVNERGEIQKVNIISPGVGFVDLPSLKTNSPTGFNATFSTIFKPIQIDLNLPVQEQVTQAILNKIAANNANPIAGTKVVVPTTITPTEIIPNEQNKIVTSITSPIQINFPDTIELISVIDCVGKFTPPTTFNVPR